ncbi:hypothetical protein LPJ75_007165, partial [Coemansia sp. RSA 2598]
MDYRDRSGYFQEDVLRVLGRPGTLGSSTGSVASSIHEGEASGGEQQRQQYVPEPLIYEALKDGNFSDSDLTPSHVLSSGGSSTNSSDTTDSSASDQLDVDAEWEEVKHIL